MQAGNRVSHGTKTKHSPETTDTHELVPREGMIDSDSWQIFHEWRLTSTWTRRLRCYRHRDFNSRVLHHGFSEWFPSVQGCSSKWSGSGLTRLSHRSIYCRHSYRLRNSHHPRATRQGARQLCCVQCSSSGGSGHQRKDTISRYKHHCQHIEPLTHKVGPIHSSSDSGRHEGQQRRTSADSLPGNLRKLSSFVASQID